jgi:hypothetical protein
MADVGKTSCTDRHMQQWLMVLRRRRAPHGGQSGTWDFFGRHDRIFGLRLYSHVAFDKASEKESLKGNRGMPSVLPLSVADAKAAEKKAWRRYAEAKDDNWREALAEWVEARDALLAAYAEEAASLHRF